MKRIRTHFQDSNAPAAMRPVPQKWACLVCRAVIKLPRDFKPGAPPRCPRCRGEIFFAGQSFRAPGQSDLKAWRWVEAMLSAGYVFHPDHLGRVPDNVNALADWERFRREQRQQSARGSREYEGHDRWQQQRRAAAWRAMEKRRRREAEELRPSPPAPLPSSGEGSL